MPMLLDSHNIIFHCIMSGSFRFIGTVQVRKCACFSSMSLKLSSGISKEEHNVGEINWYISVLEVVKFMPHKFLGCLSSVWLTGLIAERS